MPMFSAGTGQPTKIASPDELLYWCSAASLDVGTYALDFM